MSGAVQATPEQRDRLLRWFEQSARTLPWRTKRRDPYHVLVSELMLQQTQVERVVPRFEAFVDRYPDLGSLARASEDDVVEAWSGLGYYRRARALHRLAATVWADGGSLPATLEGLRELPGVGEYTAAAVASLAHDARVPVLDGNVSRVGARVLALDSDPRSAEGARELERWVLSMMEGASPGAVNEALMELGAMVCRPRTPRCGACPLMKGCRGALSGAPERWPVGRRAGVVERVWWTAAIVREPSGRWLVRRIDSGPILRGLWLPPFAVSDTSAVLETASRLVPVTVGGRGTALSPVRHSITRRRIEVRSVLFEVACETGVGDGWMWIRPERPGVPTSSLLGKLVKAVEQLVPTTG